MIHTKKTLLLKKTKYIRINGFCCAKKKEKNKFLTSYRLFVVMLLLI